MCMTCSTLFLWKPTNTLAALCVAQAVYICSNICDTLAATRSLVHTCTYTDARIHTYTQTHNHLLPRSVAHLQNMHTCTYTRAHTHKHTPSHKHKHTYTHVHAPARTYMLISIHAYAYSLLLCEYLCILRSFNTFQITVLKVRTLTHRYTNT